MTCILFLICHIVCASSMVADRLYLCDFNEHAVFATTKYGLRAYGQQFFKVRNLLMQRRDETSMRLLEEYRNRFCDIISKDFVDVHELRSLITEMISTYFLQVSEPRSHELQHDIRGWCGVTIKPTDEEFGYITNYYILQEIALRQRRLKKAKLVEHGEAFCSYVRAKPVNLEKLKELNDQLTDDVTMAY